MNVTQGFTFPFQRGELPQKLKQISDRVRTGSLKIKITSLVGVKVVTPIPWNLTFVENRLVFSGNKEISWPNFRNILQRYLLKLREAKAKKIISDLEEKATPEEIRQIGKMLAKLEAIELLHRDTVIKALQTHILADCDRYLFNSEGKAQFFYQPDLIIQAQIPGFRLPDLLLRATGRKAEWESLGRAISCPEAVPILNTEKLAKTQITDQQKKQIQKLVQLGKNLAEISYNSGKDSLEISKFFAKLVSRGLVTIEVPTEVLKKSQIPEIFIVDDSPVLLKQFQRLLQRWGYGVKSCIDPLTAVEQMCNSKPAVIFLDVNMPGMSGFELIKNIRRQSELAEIPLVLLTAEKSVSNQWRAQWANCKFLAKPISPKEVIRFQKELRSFLIELAPK